MKRFADRENRKLMIAVFGTLIGFAGAVSLLTPAPAWTFWAGYVLLSGCLLTACARHVHRQGERMEQAIGLIEAYLDGEREARLECDGEGELCRLFHGINTLASVLHAHAENEWRDKEFLKDTLSDISHQLKTPLAALNIYNGLVQGEAENLPQIRAFADLSERELDRMETLVHNLLKIARLDAGTMDMDKRMHSLSEMMKDLELSFAYRAGQEGKRLVFSGDEPSDFFCDRDWLMEAVGNLVRNALDHTKAGDSICVAWTRRANILHLSVTDTGCGIHPQDIYHIFKRFYRSRFSKDTRGIGLGLPLAKAIVEAHGGSIEVRSEPGKGTSFCISFAILTELSSCGHAAVRCE